MHPSLKALYHAMRRPLEVRRRIRGRDNVVSLGRGILRRVRVDIEGDGNTVRFEDDTIIEGLFIRIRGDGHLLTVGRGTYMRGTRIFFEDRAGCIAIGQDAWLNDSSVSSVEGFPVEIGRGCLFAEETDIRTSDSHSLVEADSGRRINPPGAVRIGEHVWIGKGAAVLKGVRIGSGSIIGMRSLVTRDVPELCVAAGTPARVLRQGVTWDWEKLPVDADPKVPDAGA